MNRIVLKALVILALLQGGVSTVRGQSGLVADYPCTGNFNDKVGSNHGTVYGATLTTDRNGIANSAYEFDGVDDYVTIPTIGPLGSFTLTARVKFTSTSLMNIFSGQNAGLYPSLSDGKVAWYDGTAWRYSTSTINDNQWHTIAYIFNNGLYISIYVDGAIEYSGLPAPQIMNGQISQLGKISSANERYFNGSLDDLRIYNRVLSQSEITSEYIGEVPDHLEFQALKAMYDSLTGPTWTTKTNWPASGSWPLTATASQMDTWYGVTVTNGDIIDITITGNNLIGKIPASVQNFAALSTLNLGNNKINSSMPASIGNLSKLRGLLLYTNLMTGPLPSSLQNLTELQSLNIFGNKFSGTIPTYLNSLTQLRQLFLSENNFTGDIPDLSALTQMVDLKINCPLLTPGPIPSWIGTFTNLITLELRSAKRNGSIPANLGNLSNLRYLFLDANQLTGSIPAELGNLSQLWYLYLSTNQLSGAIPSSLGNLSQLQFLYLNGNQLSGSIPATIGNLTNLVSLHLATNTLSGEIPSTIGNLTNLTSIFLNNNALTGSIPSSIGNLTKVVNFNLHVNKLSGSLPPSLGNLNKVIYFNIHNNQLSGEIPPEISGMTQCAMFTIENNKFTGTFPSTMATMSTITHIQAFNNQFSGPIPDVLSSMAHLWYLDLRSNNFSGTIPTSLANRTTLQELHLSGNKLSDAIPEQIGTLPVLRIVNVSSNQITGVANSLLTRTTLTTLNVSDNFLTTIQNFSTHPNKANLTLTVSNNYLDFSHLEPLKNTGIASVTYAPQKDINDQSSVQLNVGQALTVTARPTGSNSTVTWEKKNNDGTWATLSNDQDAVAQTYTRNSAQLSDEGTFRWKITNSLVTGLTLYSIPILVKTPERSTLDTWAFQYKYDGRKRMIHKKVPGADWVYMVYDNRDRLVMTQDGEQRKTNKWSFTKYDVLNRPIIAGIYTHGSFVDQAGMSALISTTNFFETYNGVLSTHGYSNTVFPTTGLDILSATYYDNYLFQGLLSPPDYDYKASQLAGQPATAFARVQGLATGSKTKVLHNPGEYVAPRWLYTTNYYDDKYRLIQSIADNATGSTDVTTSVYDFSGKILQTRATHGGKGFVTWKDVTWGVSLTGHRIFRSGGGSDNNVGAASTAILPANTDGWFEFIYSNANMIYVGFSDANVDTHMNTIDYCIRLGGSSAYAAHQNGSTGTIIGTHVLGDLFRIERSGGVIKVRRNGVVAYTFPGSSTSQLLIDVSFYTAGSELLFTKASFGDQSKSVTRSLDYDHAGRPLKTWHSIDDAAPVLLAKNEYNELGQLVAKKLYNTDPSSTPDTQRSFKQDVDYRYNIRGWLTRINNSDLSPDNTSSPRDHFGMDLVYNELNTSLNNSPAFNGNISAMTWSTNLGLDLKKERGYNFSYDTLNRLKSAAHLERTTGWNAAPSFFEGELKYDLNGNIKKLDRTGNTSVATDQLSYSYAGNQLQKVVDATANTEGFKDGLNVDNDYVYDMNGNMTLDKNKTVTAITYNHLNLPEKVTKSTGDYVRYIYDASGRKLSQGVYNAANVLQKKTDYVGEYFYENDTLKFISHEEGRVIPSGIETGLIASYSLNGSVLDDSGNGYHGNNYGGVVDIDRNNAPGALKLDGVDDYASIADNDVFDFGSSNFSVSFWVKKLKAGTGWDEIMAIEKWNTGASPGTNSWSITCGGFNSDKPNLGIESGTTIYSAESSTALTIGQWHHIVGLREGGTIRLYMDGQLKSQTSVGNVIINNTTLPVYIGRLPQGLYTNAVFDDLKLFGVALKEEDIQNLYTGNIKAFEYQYRLKDHLGNVRLTFTTKDEIEADTATLETDHAAEDESKFLRYQNARRVQSSLFDHTNGTSIGYSERLNGTANEKYGLARSLSVMPGDTVKVEVFAKYVDTNSGNWTQALTDFLAAVASGTAPPGTVVDGGGYSSSTSSFSYAGLLNTSGSSGTGPKAFINWLIFDRDYDFKNGGYVRMTDIAKETGQDVVHERLAPSSNLVITEPGYVYIYLSNENETPVEVFFDDFKVEHVKSPVVQMDDYYPFGLAFNSYNRENSTPNDYKYNGKEEQTELGLGWLDYGMRMYQPELGRFSVQDRFSEKYSSLNPYQYAANNPVLFIDVNGDSINVAEQYRNQFTQVLQSVFGTNSSSFTYSAAGNLVFTGNTEDFSEAEQSAFNDMNGVMGETTTTNIVFEKSYTITDNDGNKLTIDPSKSGGEATALVGENKISQNYVVIDPAKTSTGNVYEVTDAYYKTPIDPNGPPRFNVTSQTTSVENRTLHGLGHVIHRGQSQDKVIDFDNKTRTITKGVNSLGYYPSPLPGRKYDETHNRTVKTGVYGN